MVFEWSSAKSEANLRERGFDFAFGAMVFQGVTLEVQDRRRDYGEVRYVAVGVVDGIVLTVVYTDRNRGEETAVRRIISARRSNRHEREAYEAAVRRRGGLHEGKGPSAEAP